MLISITEDSCSIVIENRIFKQMNVIFDKPLSASGLLSVRLFIDPYINFSSISEGLIHGSLNLLRTFY